MSEPDGPGDAQPKGEHEDRPELDIDSLFAAIVADFSAPSGRGGPWPASEDLDAPDGTDESGPDGRPEDDGPVAASPLPARAGRRIVLPADSDRGDSDRADDEGPADAREDDEGYVPPEPPPFPRGDVVSRFAWASVIGGPLFLLIAALTWRTLPPVLLLLALVAFVGGFAVLVARMPNEPPDDPDDGAVV